jgi:hypothetical protein
MGCSLRRERIVEKKWPQRKFGTWLRTTSKDEFLDLLLTVERLAHESNLASRVRTVRQSRLGEPLLHQAEDISEVVRQLTKTLTGKTDELEKLSLTNKTDDLKRLLPVQGLIDSFRYAHSAYQNISAEQSFLEVQAYLDDVSRYVVGLGFSADAAKSQANDAYKEYMTIRTWLNQKDSFKGQSGSPNAITTETSMDAGPTFSSQVLKRKRIDSSKGSTHSPNPLNTPITKRRKVTVEQSVPSHHERSASAVTTQSSSESSLKLLSNLGKAAVKAALGADEMEASSQTIHKSTPGNSKKGAKLGNQVSSQLQDSAANSNKSRYPKELESDPIPAKTNKKLPIPKSENKVAARSSSPESSSEDESEDSSDDEEDSQSDDDSTSSSEEETTSDSESSSEDDTSDESEEDSDTDSSPSIPKVNGAQQSNSEASSSESESD